jgi:hypothetical protein
LVTPFPVFYPFLTDSIKNYISFPKLEISPKKALIECVESDTCIMTNESPSYFGVNQRFANHQADNYKKGEYVRKRLT